MNLNEILSKARNPFIRLTLDEKTELKKVEGSVKRDIKAFSVEAKNLYDDHRYQKLKNEFKRIYQQNINLIIYFDAKDAQEYIMKMREYQIQLRTLKSIFDTPEGFIKSEEALNKEI